MQHPALVLPEATTPAMDLFLAEFGANLADDGHAIVALDRAGGHGAKALAVPDDVTPVPPW